MTLDLDFSNVSVYSSEDVPGIVLLRMNEQSIDTTLTIVERTLSVFGEETPIGKLWIVDKKKVRVREL